MVLSVTTLPNRLNPQGHSGVLDSSLNRWIFCLIGLTTVACFWFPSTPLPAGGPNILLGIVTTFLVLLHFVAGTEIRQSFVANSAATQILIVSLSMLIWTIGVLIVTDTFSQQVFGSFVLGPGVFLASVISITSERRIFIFSAVLTISVLLSAAFGFLVLHGHIWFLTLWLEIAAPTPEFAEDVELGRLAGLAPRVVNFSFHLALATPLSVAMLLFNPISKKIIRYVFDIGVYITTVLLMTSVFLNGSRSLLISTICGIMLPLTALMRQPAGDERAALIRRAALSLIALIIGVFVMLTTYNAIFRKNTPPDLGRVISIPPSCLDEIGEISGEIRIVGRPSMDCRSTQRPDSLARYYQFSLESPSLISIEAISDGTNPYLYLYSGETTPKLHAQNDNGADQLNARIVDGRLDPGIYIVEFTTYDPAPPEDFTLTITTDCPDEETIKVTEYDKNIWTSAWGVGCAASSRQGEGTSRYFRALLSEAPEFYIQIETDGITPYIYLHSDELGQTMLPSDSTTRLIGDRWKQLKHTYHDLSPGNYVIEVTNNAVGIESNFVILSWQTLSAEATPIETPAPSSSKESRSRAESLDQMNNFSADTKRLFDFSEGALLRLYMMVTAVRYILEFPLGTGNKYVPGLNHIEKSWGRENVTRILASIPHNQFLYCAVQYGFPGLASLVVLHVVIFTSSLRSMRLFSRCRSSGSRFLCVAPSASMVSYFVNSLFHDHGPFTNDWIHFVILGLIVNSDPSKPHRQT